MALTYIGGYDGSEAARAAMRLTKRMGEAMGARVVAVHVYEPVPVVYGKGEQAGARSALRDDVREAAERILAELGEPGVELRLVAAPSPARGLQESAEEEGASLLTVGATHRGELGRIVVGSVADRLLHGAPCPVGVVPAGAREDPSTVAVAYDGGEEAGRALLAGQVVAAKLGARLLLLAAVEPEAYPLREPFGLSPEELEEHLREAMTRKLDGVAGRLPPDVEAETHVVPGTGGPAIVAACKEMGVEMLVSGSRGYGPVRSVLLGSVSRYLVDHAPCPVIVVPRGTGARLDRPPPTEQRFETQQAQQA